MTHTRRPIRSAAQTCSCGVKLRSTLRYVIAMHPPFAPPHESSQACDIIRHMLMTDPPTHSKPAIEINSEMVNGAAPHSSSLETGVPGIAPPAPGDGALMQIRTATASRHRDINGDI